MKRLEQVRLEVDSRRHTVNSLNRAIDKARAKAQAAPRPPAGAIDSPDYDIDKTIRKMQHKENKLAGACGLLLIVIPDLQGLTSCACLHAC